MQTVCGFVEDEQCFATLRALQFGGRLDAAQQCVKWCLKGRMHPKGQLRPPAPGLPNTIGFDRLFDFAESAQRGAEEGYPPYNIERLAEDRYQITLAVTGFSPDEISITADKPSPRRRQNRESRARIPVPRHLDPPFKRQFNLADYVQ